MIKPNIHYNHEIEKNLLGVFLIESTAFSQCAHLLREEIFYKPEHKEVFKVLAYLHDQNLPIDLLTVGHQFYQSGVQKLDNSNVAYFLAGLCLDVVSSAHVERWAMVLRELAISRAMVELTHGGMKSTDPLEAAALYETKIKSLTELKVVDDWKTAQAIEAEQIKYMQDLKSGVKTGITTGIHGLDSLNGFFRPTQLVIVAARPSVGKSALMGVMAAGMAFTGIPVGVISLEMENRDIFARISSATGDIPFHQIDRNEFLDSQDNKMALEAMSRIGNLPLYFSDTAKVTSSDIRSKAEKLKRKHPDLGALFIDYIQLINPEKSNKSREQEVAELSRNLKLLAKLIQVPIIVLAQLNREADKGEPQLTHLRESGSLEQDADVVLMIDRDTQTQDPAISNQASLFVRKWRNGKTSKIPMLWDGSKMKFYEPSAPFENANSSAIMAASQNVMRKFKDDVPF